jgi:23S rRNA (adenine2503-C2)-methyltransferase
MKKNLKDLTIEELKQFCVGEGFESYRADQMFRWIWKKGKNSFSDITTISKKQRELLEEKAAIPTLKCLEVVQAKDRASKFVFGLHDKHIIESVYIPTRKRKTVCVSTQVGCSLKCAICMTGRSGYKRNLHAWEIADQVRKVESYVEERISNIVLMGMGEPLLNYENVLKAIRIMNEDLGMNIGARKITVSTAGIIPGIMKLSREPLQVKLAVSLNAADDEKRESIMPISKKYNLKRLFDALDEYYTEKGKRITFEYVIIKGFNDSLKDARMLAKLTERIPCKINIIPFNPIDDSDFRAPDSGKINRFIEYLYPIAQSVTLRESRGGAINGACGQLRSRRRIRERRKLPVRSKPKKKPSR